jgi:hypothetical protein
MGFPLSGVEKIHNSTVFGAHRVARVGKPNRVRLGVDNAGRRRQSDAPVEKGTLRARASRYQTAFSNRASLSDFSLTMTPVLIGAMRNP